MTSAVAIVSGGMDSVTLLHDLVANSLDVHVLSFNYGQKHVKELEFAKYWADRFGFDHDIIDLSSLTHLLTSSALVTGNDEAIPEGHYAAENMKSTVVPNRNMMMLSIAGSVAVNNKARYVAIGVHGGDHDIYPDCRPEFLDSFERTLFLGNTGYAEGISVYAPFSRGRKEDIAILGEKMGVDWDKTWSCYKGEELHCGCCGTCTERIEAFQLAEIDDPTVYSYDEGEITPNTSDGPSTERTYEA